MHRKKIGLLAFILVALAQLYVPAKMIIDKELVLHSGKEFKFRTAPVDPNDQFRGKYITLSYSDNVVEVDENEKWNRGENIYALIETDNEGFAFIESVSREKPENSEDYLFTKVQYNGQNKLFVEFPFDRFYMEESKAYDAEMIYRENERDITSTTYALVRIKEGEAVLENVFIDDIPIKDLVEAGR